MKSENVNILNWCSCSSDLIATENLWGIMVKKFYAGFRHFSTKAELLAAEFEAWVSVTEDVLQSLMRSILKRCVSVLQKKGGPTHY